MLQVRILPGLLFGRSHSVRKIVQFFKDSYAELKKVIWPSREEVGSSTKVVLVSVALFAIVLGLIDYVFLTGIDILF
jgi:preprotein translocase subunit SecE